MFFGNKWFNKSKMQLFGKALTSCKWGEFGRHGGWGAWAQPLWRQGSRHCQWEMPKPRPFSLPCHKLSQTKGLSQRELPYLAVAVPPAPEGCCQQSVPAPSGKGAGCAQGSPYSKAILLSFTLSFDNDPLMERIKVGSPCLAAVLHSLLMKTGFGSQSAIRRCSFP